MALTAFNPYACIDAIIGALEAYMQYSDMISGSPMNHLAASGGGIMIRPYEIQ